MSWENQRVWNRLDETSDGDSDVYHALSKLRKDKCEGEAHQNPFQRGVADLHSTLHK